MAGNPSSFKFFFNVGSEYNATQDTQKPTVSGLLNTTLEGSSIYSITVHDTGAAPALSGLTEIASGLRNASGIAVQPGTGNLWFVDNGIDGPNSNPYAAVSADTLHTIAAAQIGQSIPFFGFPNNYIAYNTGQFVGGAGGAARGRVPAHSRHGKRLEIRRNATGVLAACVPAALQDGVFIGFHGMFANAGVTNDENPVLFSSLTSGNYFDFLSNDLSLGHPDGLLSTNNSLFVADLSSNGALSGSGVGQGVIYQIQYIPEPASFVLAGLGFATVGCFAWRKKQRQD